MDKVTFTRSELYSLVWKFPLVQIAKHYDISTMGIKNACDKMQIAVPNNRHWNKLEYKRTKAPKLSSDYIGSNEIDVVKKRYEMQLRKPSKQTPLLDLVQKIEHESNDFLMVKNKLENPAKIVSDTEKYSNFLKENNHENLEILNLNISDESLNRALLFMDAFIKLIEYRGHRFQKNNKGNDTVLFNNGIEIEIDLREALKRITIEGKRETSKYVSTGELILRAKKESIKNEWRDGKILLEYKLALILAKLELIAAE
ncbi:hypothetical protein K6T82_22030 [Flavobacterium sp. 17A]|uniref:Uncharacterized protein n=1 Tax=Flavobacterium potami TaxID=2872310 RepID=A0A9X1HEN3_9FLAO|nr:hypothetical protein [Flavobacterium potami]MBZ4037456.1 hypothetical protein [Flavobacterium potami]